MDATFVTSPQDIVRPNWTYFTFFSESRDGGGVAVPVVETLALSLIFVVSLLGNICAITLLARKKRLVSANCFVLNLFCADLLFISTIPCILATRWSGAWVLGDFCCHILFYVMSLSGCVTISSLAAVSLERMVCIMRLHQASSCDVKVVAGGLLSIWGFSALTTVPLCVFFRVTTQPANGKDFQICTLIWPTVESEIIWDIAFVILDFLIPGLSIIIGYSKIYQITKETRRNLTASMAHVESQELLVSQKDYKLFRTLMVLMFSFFVMWSPIVITVLLIAVRNFKKDFTISSTLFFWIMTFTFANSALNPILYNVSDVRHKWWQVLCCRLSNKESDSSDATTRRNDHEQPDLSIVGK
ncbi:free fatty acid receptor 4 [Ambystoma mexicanum]|uniref:free fatty acid receptor 4 n=1 Tax=Ambystoma mexicanum TaxID=8296 RepID=UPI0037E91636